MTEADWLGCADPVAMLDWLCGRTSERKLRLLAVACCRRVGHLFTDDRSRAIVDLIERYADGRTNEWELAARGEARAGLEDAVGKVWGGQPIQSEAASLVRQAASRDPVRAARETVLRAAAVVTAAATGPCPFDTPDLVHHVAWRAAYRVAWEKASGEFCRLVREVFGNPFRPARVMPCSLAWDDGIVPAIALAIYAEGAFERLPILADALEDAGCDDAVLLDHCRAGGAHVRGCWVVDLLLGRG
jgi:hypothetical protein